MSQAEICSLCLEIIVDLVGQIDIDSSKGNALNAREILERYFKEELAKVAESSSTLVSTPHAICRLCWESVFTFHQFCLRVQRAHETLFHSSQLGKDEELTDFVTIPAKRRRGRSRRRTMSKRNSEDTAALDGQVILEQDEKNLVETDLLRPPSTENNIQVSELPLIEIKSEVLQEELVDADYFSNSADSSTLLLKDNLSDTKLDMAQAKKTARPRTMQASKDDEYIAQRFKLTCCLCDSLQENFGVLRKHFRKHHKTSGYVICCGKKLRERLRLVDHLHFHENPQYFKCAECGKALADRDCLERHTSLHKNVERRHKCDVCSKSFSRSYALLVHSKTHLEEKNYACPECGKRFSTEFFVTRHVNQVHVKKYAKICDICGKSIQKREDLERHMDEHAGIERPLIRCELCGITVTTSYGLARHTKLMHTNAYRTPHTCPICSRVSTSRRGLQRHIKYMHTMKPKHSCPMCDKVFKRPEQLREHMSTHTGEILYTCSFCPRTFISNANMHSHIKKTHPNEWEEKRLQKYNTLPKRMQADKHVQDKAEANSA